MTNGSKSGEKDGINTILAAPLKNLRGVLF
jgi:hypothetical protein